MATYKVLQDIEAEDKLVGPLTLRQFIYAAITLVFFYLSFFAYTKNASFLIALFLPPALFTAFLAIPWRGDQPTEVWAIAKLRFLVKPRKRIWDQSGVKSLVTITVPKKVERHLTNGLTQGEVRSRLHALASTIDSRGWAVKNSNLNLNHSPVQSDTSDRLLEATMLPQEVNDLDIDASDDILDSSANPIAQQFDSMMSSAAITQKQRIVQSLSGPMPDPAAATQAPPAAPVAAPVVPVVPADQPSQWFTPRQATTPPIVAAPVAVDMPLQPVTSPDQTPFVPQAATPTPDEEALLAQSVAINDSMGIATGHMKRIQTPEEIAAGATQPASTEPPQMAAAPTTSAPLSNPQSSPDPTLDSQQKAQVTSDTQAAIMNLAQNDDLSVATIAREANRQKGDDQEVVISLR